MLFIAVYSKQGSLVTPQNMLLVRRCKIDADYAAEEPDSLEVIKIMLVL